MNLNNWRLAHRLWLGFGAVLLLACLLAGLGMARLRSIQQDFAGTLALDDQSDQAERWAQLTQLNISRALSLAKVGGNAELQAYLDPQIKATSAAINTLQQAIVAQASGPEARQLIQRIADQRQAYLGVRKNVLDSAQADPAAAQRAVTTQLVPASEAYLAAINAFRDHQQAQAKEHARQAGAAAQSAITAIGVLALGCLGCGIAAAAAITRSVTRPVQQALDLTGRIAQCDLSGQVEVRGRDEMAQLLRGLDAMQQRLRDVVGTVHQASESIQVASREVAAGSMDLSHRTELAASNLQQTASSTEQISATVQNTAESARQAKQLAGSARDVTAHGTALLAQLQQAMGEITTQSSRVGEITTLIDSIAFQTNLLALNAAVEAARAGEHGRGFAVVASEVRALAGRAAAAARQIAQLVEGSSVAAGKAAGVAATTLDAMQGTADSVTKVDSIVSAIRDASQEQSLGVQQLNNALGELDQMTQQNAALVEQSAAAAESLQDQAAELARIVSVFRLHGQPAQARVAAAF